MRGQFEGFNADSVVANFTARKQAGQTFSVSSVAPGAMEAGKPTYPFSYVVGLGEGNGTIEGSGSASCTSGLITSLTVPDFTPPSDPPGDGDDGGAGDGGGSEGGTGPAPEPDPAP